MLTGILILLLVLTALLAIPVALEFTLAWPHDKQNAVILVWALGLVRTRVGSASATPPSPSGEEPRDAKKRGASKPGLLLGVIRERAFRRRIIRFVRDVWRSINKDNVRFRARIGLGDPADTGKLWAVCGPVSALLSEAKTVSVAITPDFVDEIIEIEGEGKIRLVPLHILVLVFGLLFSPAIWRGLRTVRTA